jgi:hypothetical protein
MRQTASRGLLHYLRANTKEERPFNVRPRGAHSTVTHEVGSSGRSAGQGPSGPAYWR